MDFENFVDVICVMPVRFMAMDSGKLNISLKNYLVQMNFGQNISSKNAINNVSYS